MLGLTNKFMMTEQQSKQLWDYHNSVELTKTAYAESERRFDIAFNDLKQSRFIADQCQRDYDELKRKLKV
jgi:hypothetical protein